MVVPLHSSISPRPSSLRTSLQKIVLQDVIMEEKQEFTFPRLCLSDVGGHLVEAQTGKIDLEK